MDELYTMDRPRQMPFCQSFPARRKGVAWSLQVTWLAVAPRHAEMPGWKTDSRLRRYTHDATSRLRRFVLQLWSVTSVQFSVRTKI